MAAADWITVPNSLDSATLARGATSGLSTPLGGSSFTYGWRSLANGVSGCHALRCDLANFNPIPGNEGGQITGALLRNTGSSAADHSVFLFFQMQTDDVDTGTSYILGLSAGDPGGISLRKGTVVGGLPDSPAGTDGVLRRSTSSVAQGEWVHLRLDVISNPSGDVILNVFQNDLSTNDVTTPVWAAIPGMSSYTDDVLGINSGTPGLAAGGRMGIGYQMATSGVVGAADHVTIGRTT